MPIYMKFGEINGSVTAAGYERWIELLSCSWNCARMITTSTGRGFNREASVAALSDVTVTLRQDAKAKGKLYQEALAGFGEPVKIHYVKTDKDKFEPYVMLELEDGLISAYLQNGEGGDHHDRPMQQLSINYTKITYSSSEMDSKNKTGKMHRMQWDLATGSGG